MPQVLKNIYLTANFHYSSFYEILKMNHDSQRQPPSLIATHKGPVLLILHHGHYILKHLIKQSNLKVNFIYI